MTDLAPTIYLLYGNDEFGMAEFIQSMKQKLGDDSTIAMNFSRFNASDLVWSELESAASSMPFLASRRMIVLDQAERVQKKKETLERLLRLLDQIPPSTAFLLLERSASSKDTPASSGSTLRKWVKDHPSVSYMRAFEIPHGTGFAAWLQKRAAAEGGAIEREAAELLSEWIQEDPRLAAQELAKLLDYVDRQRPIVVGDVEQCTPYRGQANVFALVDAIGIRRGDQALMKLHQVLQEDEPGYAFAMILRQFRLILRARELMDSGLALDHTIHRSEFVVRKVASQARNFSQAEIERIFHELLAIDLRSKNGQMDLDVALDHFVATITA
ncbi:MAG: DNA polymerase III subunit delta [Anaerolineales bacterium]|nr:MAG: DNA polymerase III subunit delta [Anaerolineales bacterium]